MGHTFTQLAHFNSEFRNLATNSTDLTAELFTSTGEFSSNLIAGSAHFGAKDSELITHLVSKRGNISPQPCKETNNEHRESDTQRDYPNKFRTHTVTQLSPNRCQYIPPAELW